MAGRYRNDRYEERPRNRHPPGLTGPQIGMFYKQRAMETKRAMGIAPEPTVQVERMKASVIMNNELYNNIENKLAQMEKVEYQTENVSKEFETHFHDILRINFDEFVLGKMGPRRFLRSERDDQMFYNILTQKIDLDSEYLKRLDMRKKLPVYNMREDIIEAIENNMVILISGDTGCGKTTQVPQYILDDYIYSMNGSICNIVCTQPRRISAVTVSERVAWERCENLGESVGYSIRLESIPARFRGSLTYCTTGTLLRRMESDPLLQDISHIIIDEIHERNVESDLLLVLLKKILPYRPELKVILMSATFSFEKFARYFNNCKIFQIHGTLFPVEEKYLEDVLEETSFFDFKPMPKKHNNSQRYVRKEDMYGMNAPPIDDFQSFIAPFARSLRGEYSKKVIETIQNPDTEELNLELIERLIFNIAQNKPTGAILVFLPGFDRISKLYKLCTSNRMYNENSYRIFPLHSLMPTAEQKLIFETPPSHVRKVIIATNIAESSITIEDVVYVINAGKSKLTDFDLEHNYQTLEEKWITLANSQQRKGRAGRVRPGICYHLYTRAREYTLDRYPSPEIIRTRLEGLILNLKMLHINDVVQLFNQMIDVPSPVAIENGITLLKRIDALDENENLTPLGLHLSRLPIDPQMGKMLIMGSLFRCLDPISSVAAALSHKEPFFKPLGKEKQVDEVKSRFAGVSKSDHLMLANVLDEYLHNKKHHTERNFAYRNFLSLGILSELSKMKVQFCELLRNAKFISNEDPNNEESNSNCNEINLVRAVIAAGLYPNIAFLKNSKRRKNFVKPMHVLSTQEDMRVNFFPGSSNANQLDFESNYFVYFLKRKSKQLFILDSSMIYPMALIMFGDKIQATNNYISVANYIVFQSDARTTNLVIKLRYMLNILLQRKALYPSPIEPGTEDALLLECIKLLLQSDDLVQLEDNKNESE